MRNLNFVKDENQNLQVEISVDTKSIIFANGRENFFLELTNGVEIQRKIMLKKNQQIEYFQADHVVKNGFYYVISNKYERTIDIMHSHRNNFKLSIFRNYDPHELKFFNLVVKNDQADDCGTANIEGQSKCKCNITLVSRRDNEFFWDEFQYVELLKSNNQENQDLIKFHNSTIQGEYKHDLAQRNSVSALSICWPYIVFSPLPNVLFIYNIFDNLRAHKVQIP